MVEGAEGEPFGDGGEFFAAAEAVCAEALLEEAADDGDEGSAAGEEDAVDVARGDVGVRQEAFDAGRNRLHVLLYPGLEAPLLDARFDVDGIVTEGEAPRLAVGEFDLGAFDGAVEFVAEVVLDDVDDGFDLFGFDRLTSHLIENIHRVRRLEKRHQMPVGEFGIDPDRHV